MCKEDVLCLYHIMIKSIKDSVGEELEHVCRNVGFSLCCRFQSVVSL